MNIKTTKPIINFSSTSFMALALLVTRPQLTSAKSAPAQKPFTAPLAMAGFREEPVPPNDLRTYIEGERRDYLKEKDELNKAIQKCKKYLRTCNPNIRKFMEMESKVKSNFSNPIKVLIANAYINIAIIYDFDELNKMLKEKKKNPYALLKYHTLLQTVEYSRGICEEVAKLKVFTLESMGFDPKDVRYVVEKIYETDDAGVEEDANILHAVATVRIASRGVTKVWVMNNNGQEVSAGSKDPWIAAQMVLSASIIEPDAVSLNTNGKSAFAVDSNIYEPIAGFSSAGSYIYSLMDNIGTFPLKPSEPSYGRVSTSQVSLDAKPEIRNLDIPQTLYQDAMLSWFQKNPVGRVLLSAFGPNRPIVDHGIQIAPSL